MTENVDSPTTYGTTATTTTSTTSAVAPVTRHVTTESAPIQVDSKTSTTQSGTRNGALNGRQARARRRTGRSRISNFNSRQHRSAAIHVSGSEEEATHFASSDTTDLDSLPHSAAASGTEELSDAKVYI
jgi:hypothetical protein